MQLPVSADDPPFSEEIAAGLVGVSSGAQAWGDYDSDGRLDILINGSAASGNVSRVYHNNGDGSFTDVAAGLPASSFAGLAWGDYDNDTRLDILLTGVWISC